MAQYFFGGWSTWNFVDEKSGEKKEGASISLLKLEENASGKIFKEVGKVFVNRFNGQGKFQRPTMSIELFKKMESLYDLPSLLLKPCEIETELGSFKITKVSFPKSNDALK